MEGSTATVLLNNIALKFGVKKSAIASFYFVSWKLNSSVVVYLQYGDRDEKGITQTGRGTQTRMKILRLIWICILLGGTLSVKT